MSKADDLPTFTAEDFLLLKSSPNNPNRYLTPEEAGTYVNCRLAEWKAGLTVVCSSDKSVFFSEELTQHKYKAYIFGVSEIKKGVTKAEIISHLLSIHDWNSPGGVALANRIREEGIINE